MNVSDKICVVSAANRKSEKQYLLTNPNKQAYCDVHGYDFKFTRLEECEYVGDPHFSKYWLVEREIRTGLYDCVVWMDVDAWFNNGSVLFRDVLGKYAKQDTVLVIARDQGMMGCDERLFDNYVNTGVMAFSADDAGLELLRKYNALRENQTARRMIEAMTTWRDQPYMCLLALVDEFARSRTAITSPYDLNTFAQCGFSDETFICHCPSKAAKDRLEEYMEQSKIKQNRLYLTQFFNPFIVSEIFCLS